MIAWPSWTELEVWFAVLTIGLTLSWVWFRWK